MTYIAFIAPPSGPPPSDININFDEQPDGFATMDKEFYAALGVHFVNVANSDLHAADFLTATFGSPQGGISCLSAESDTTITINVDGGFSTPFTAEVMGFGAAITTGPITVRNAADVILATSGAIPSDSNWYSYNLPFAGTAAKVVIETNISSNVAFDNLTFKAP